MTESPFPPQITNSGARSLAASLIDEYVEVGGVPAITAVDLLDGAAAGECRALGLTVPQARHVLATLFADRREPDRGGAVIWT